MPYSHSSRNRLSERDLGRFPGETLFDRVGRVLCRADCLPRKELYEAWEVARRVRRTLRGGRVVDLASGHGLLAHLMLLLDDSSTSALCVDVRVPASAAAVHDAMARAWPRLSGRLTTTQGPLAAATLAPSDLVVSAHACGALTDEILSLAIAARARVAVLPCCHDESTCDTGHLDGWLDAPLAIDVTRAARLTAAGYRVRTMTIPDAITPKNRLLVAAPA